MGRDIKCCKCGKAIDTDRPFAILGMFDCYCPDCVPPIHRAATDGMSKEEYDNLIAKGEALSHGWWLDRAIDKAKKGL